MGLIIEFGAIAFMPFKSLSDVHACDYSWIFEPDPYEYDTSMPNSSFIKYMHEQNKLFYTTLPEARRAAEEKKWLKELIIDYWKLYGTLPDRLESAIPVPLYFNYEVKSSFSRLNHATAEFQPHHKLGHAQHGGPSYSYIIGGSSLACSAPLNSFPSPTETTSWSAFPSQIPSSATAVPPPLQSPPIHSPTHTTPPPAKIAHNTKCPHPARPSSALSNKPQICTSTKPINQNGLSWSSQKIRLAAVAPTMRLSLLPINKRQIKKKPRLACLFCRGRKIACGALLLGTEDETCNQCQRRSLQCEYPAENRRGMRKKKVLKDM